MHHFATMTAAGMMVAAAVGMVVSASAQVAVEAKGKVMKGFVGGIEKLTEKNSDYRYKS